MQKIYYLLFLSLCNLQLYAMDEKCNSAYSKFNFLPNLQIDQNPVASVQKIMEMWAKACLKNRHNVDVLNIFDYKSDEPAHFLLGNRISCSGLDYPIDEDFYAKGDIFYIPFIKNDTIKKGNQHTLIQKKNLLDEVMENLLISQQYEELPRRLIVPAYYLDDLCQLEKFNDLVNNQNIQAIDIVHNTIDFNILHTIWSYYMQHKPCEQDSRNASLTEQMHTTINDAIQFWWKVTDETKYNTTKTAFAFWFHIMSPIIQQKDFKPGLFDENYTWQKAELGPLLQGFSKSAFLDEMIKKIELGQNSEDPEDKTYLRLGLNFKYIHYLLKSLHDNYQKNVAKYDEPRQKWLFRIAIILGPIAIVWVAAIVYYNFIRA